MRKIYLESRPRLEARQLLLEKVRFEDKEGWIMVGEALGRVTSRAVFARYSLPTFPAAAMDGIAVRARDTIGASDQHPRTLVPERDYVVIDTGDPLPDGFDAVIKVEDLQPLEENRMEIMSPVAPGQHVRPVGEDVVAGEIIVPAYHLLTPPDLGAILAGGLIEVAVLKRPRVAIIPTGDELITPGKKPGKGEIIEFNGTVLAAYLRQWGAEPVLQDIVRDDLALLQEAVTQALATADIVIINAGSSAGRDDYTYQIITSLGDVLAHGVATRPGKPTVLGTVQGKPLLGLPGYPVSAYLALEWFVRPLISQYLHQTEPCRPKLRARMARRVVSDLGSEEFVRVTVGYINGRFIAMPLARGAGVTMSLVKADGLLVIPANSLGHEQGEEVEIELYRPEQQLRNTLVAAGSHDLALDLLATALRKADPGLFLSSSHLGSMGGISAIMKGEAHLAGVHLFDSATGDYNISYVKKYLAGMDVLLVNLVYRQQGWIIEKGNPLQIEGIKDLAARKAVFVNRQKGAGTRLLFDYLLEREGMKAADVYGYNREEYTHLNVAAAVAAGTAQVGLGILSAVRAYDLDFVPVGEERYDLLMTKEFYNSQFGQAVIKIITDPLFQKEVEDLGGYSMRDAGKIIFRNLVSE